jgi:hypothetical protein
MNVFGRVMRPAGDLQPNQRVWRVPAVAEHQAFFAVEGVKRNS